MSQILESLSSDSSQVNDAKKFLEVNKPLIRQDVFIDESFFYCKNLEFRVWLRSKKACLDSMSLSIARRHFRKFVARWNQGRLKDKFYKLATPSDLEGRDWTATTEWAINVDMTQFGAIQDIVRDLTESKQSLGSSSHYQEARNPNAPKEVVRNPGEALEKMEERERFNEERQRLDQIQRKKQLKEEREHHEMVLDELLPKKTGREATLEKRQMKGAYAKKGDSPEPDIAERDLFGGDDFAARLAREQELRRRKEESNLKKNLERAELMKDKVAAYEAKEADTMAMLRELAKQHHKL